ncbi:pirin family protein [Chondrinema litorale]|uniref:pirin family protein n=1 Tax=Chondrinema litorale TaxID=2994555 RepID=UPI002542A9C9|nr:pirin family protein [Chondrinema litorale]UZR98728.1 pirin family protein [Chondrinema litorale]
MMKNRSVKQIMYAQEVTMGEMPVRQPFPTQSVDQINPFLLLHHHKTTIEGGSHPRNMGVSPHPHRGFSPVTFIIEGDVHHRDSRGNSSVVEAGGVQWLNAGMGINHSERPSKKLAENGGVQEIIQLWVNTPQINKMDQPLYQAFSKEALPIVSGEDGLSEVKVVTGEFNNVKGPVISFSPMLILWGEVKSNGKVKIDIPTDYNASVYFIKGKAHVKNFGVIDDLNLMYFENDGDQITIYAKEENIQFLLIAGKPINEPVVSHGPFVMNTQTEIMTAMRDFQLGKMGVLIEEF